MDILAQADPLLDFDDSTAWVRGWERPIQRAIARAIPRNTADSANLNSILSGFFQQVRQRLDSGTPGGDAFKHLLRLIANQFGDNDRGETFTALNNFGVDNGTTFSRFLQLYRVAVANATNYSSLLSPDESWVIEITRNKINEQYPSLAPLCFPGRLATDPKPYASLDSMWRAFDNISGNKTPATNGSRFAVLPAFDRLSLGSSLNSSLGSSSGHGRSSSRFGHTRSSASSSGRPYVMTVQPQRVADVFDQFYPEWPLGSDDHWETVFNVSERFTNYNLPPLWTPLTSRHDRQAAFIENSGRCLNCGVAGHSLRQCNRPFTNASGILNPELGRLNDNDAAFQTWLQRMRSHKANNPHHRSAHNRRNDRRTFTSYGRNDQSGPLQGNQGPSDPQAERFRARHVTGYTSQPSGSSGLSVYQPGYNVSSSSSTVNHVMSSTRFPSGSAENTRRHRSPYSGRG